MRKKTAGSSTHRRKKELKDLRPQVDPKGGGAVAGVLYATLHNNDVVMGDGSVRVVQPATTSDPQKR